MKLTGLGESVIVNKPKMCMSAHKVRISSWIQFYKFLPLPFRLNGIFVLTLVRSLRKHYPSGFACDLISLPSSLG